MNYRIETALSCFYNGFNCAQSVFSSFHDELNIDMDFALKLSCGFGGGMGRKQEVCGAVTGGLLVIGANYGQDTLGDKENTEDTYLKTRILMDTVREAHGTYICRELVKDCDFLTEEGQKKFQDLDLKKNVCSECIKTVIETVEEIIKIKN